MSKTIAGIPEHEVAEANAKMTKIKTDAFDMAKHFARGDFTDYNAYGYKSREDALIKIIMRATNECEKVMTTLERKYP